MSYITIYFGEKPVFLCDKLHSEIDEIRHHPDAVYIDELSRAAINSLLHEISKPQFHAGIIFNENFQKLQWAIRQLSEIERAMIMMALEEIPYEEIAETIGITQNNVRVRMNRIREKLKKLMCP